MSDESMMSIQEVASRLSVSERTVRRLVKAGAIQATNVGRQYRFEKQWIAEYVSVNKKGYSDE